MRNKNGITMISLVIYVLSFAIIIGIVGSVTVFFSSGMREMNQNAAASSEYNKFNIYMSKYTKNGYNIILDEYENNQYIAFEKDGDKIVFEKVGDILYVDSVKLCENVDEFDAKAITTENGKDMLKTKIKINGVVYTTDYVIETPEAPEGEPVEESTSLISALVDDLGTRSTIYLYGNPEVTQSGQTIAVEMTEYPENSTTNSLTTQISSVSTTRNEQNILQVGSGNYATYTVSKNGNYKFKATLGTEETELEVKVKNIEKFTPIERITGLNYAGNGTKAYSYKEAAVPKGYFVDTNSKVTTGLVITDAIDAEGYSTGNEWVWVPVNSAVGNNDFYYEGTGTVAGTTNVTFTKYSKLWDFTTDPNTGVTTRTAKSAVDPSATSGFREPGILTESSGEVTNYGYVNKRNSNPIAQCTSVDEVATQYVTDFNNMVDNVIEYGGFFIGRYELTANGERPGIVLANENWYTFYNQCMTYGSNYTESGMIYGTLWDATMQWLAKSSYWVGYSGQIYSGYGNYKTEEVSIIRKNIKIIVKEQATLKKMITGQTSYTKGNNIYDLAGNYYEWIQLLRETKERICKGGCYDNESNVYAYANSNFQKDVNIGGMAITSRPCLYIK